MSRQRSLLAFILALPLFMLLTGAAAGWFWLNQANSNEAPIVVDIPKGATLSGLSREWESAGWLNSAFALRVAGKVSGLSRDIHPGEFIIPARMNNFELLSFLATAKPRTYRITLIEGRPLTDALQVLSEAEHVRQDLPDLTPAGIAAFLDLSADPEAQLYPDTYVYYRDEPVSGLITQAHERLNQVLMEEWENRAPDLPYKTPYEALIMASIVEKEPGVASERSVIAGVFVRRLQRGMRLETDPTVIYGAGNGFDGNLTRAHLRDRSNKYNTYRHKGLPPGPIALAGRAAIHAALHPADGTELYFVAKGDGSHYFSSTLEEHNEAVRRYQLKRRSDYRSSPAPQEN